MYFIDISSTSIISSSAFWKMIQSVKIRMSYPVSPHLVGNNRENIVYFRRNEQRAKQIWK